MPRSRSSAFESITRSGDDLARIERAGLPQELVDQRGLAVVDVRDDRDVAKLDCGVEGHDGSARSKRARSIQESGTVPRDCPLPTYFVVSTAFVASTASPPEFAPVAASAGFSTAGN